MNFRISNNRGFKSKPALNLLPLFEFVFAMSIAALRQYYRSYKKGKKTSAVNNSIGTRRRDGTAD